MVVVVVVVVVVRGLVRLMDGRLDLQEHKETLKKVTKRVLLE